jgi:hypothetical protein
MWVGAPVWSNQVVGVVGQDFLYHLEAHGFQYIHIYIYIYIFTILKAPISTVVMRHFFTNNPSQLFQINPLHVYIDDQTVSGTS